MHRCIHACMHVGLHADDECDMFKTVEVPSAAPCPDWACRWLSFVGLFE